MIDIGQTIKDLLYQKKISQAELARMLGVSPQSINSSLRKPNLYSDFIQKIIQVTGIKASEIFQETSETSIGEPEADYHKSDKTRTLEVDLKLCQQETDFLKKQIEEKERMIQMLLKKE